MTDAEGEHVVLSDGHRRIRIDLAEGSLARGEPVILHFQLSGVISIEPAMTTLRNLIMILKYRRFAPSRYPSTAHIDRHLMVLRVRDALATGASQREMTNVLFGHATSDRADSLRSRVRRLVREARRMTKGGWRHMMRDRAN